MAKIEVKSEITGTVWEVKAKPGDRVEAGDTLRQQIKHACALLPRYQGGWY